jgi:hypothetical protein
LRQADAILSDRAIEGAAAPCFPLSQYSEALRSVA